MPAVEGKIQLDFLYGPILRFSFRVSLSAVALVLYRIMAVFRFLPHSEGVRSP